MRFKKQINIALIRPPVLELRTNLSSYGAILPIGLGYIAAVLRDAGHKISVIDAPGEALTRSIDMTSPIGPLSLNGLTPEEIVERIDPETEIVGITHMFLHEWPTIKQIAELAKKKNPDLIVILGGENATAFWDQIFQETDAVDYCVFGEGELVILALLERLQNNLDVADLKGAAAHPKISGNKSAAHFSNNMQDVSTIVYAKEAASQLAGRVLEPDSIPRPAWEYFPVEQYMQTADHHGVNRGRSMPLLATRGCPYQCTFCSSPQMWTTRYVTRKPREVVEEMKSYVAKYHVDNFNFCDLTAIIKKEWILEFCNILKKEKLNVTWQLPTGTRSEALDEEVLPLVYETGCRNITYAPESGSERMLKTIKKKVQISRMLGSLYAAHKANLVTRVNIIIGHPEERRADTWKSLKFLIQCALRGCQDAAVMIFAPYPGSEDTKKLITQGRLKRGPEYYYLALARSGWSSRTYNPRMGTRELIIMQFFMLLVFYAVAYLSRPWRFINMIQSLITGKEQTQLDQLLRTKFKREFKPFQKVDWTDETVTAHAFREN